MNRLLCISLFFFLAQPGLCDFLVPPNVGPESLWRDNPQYRVGEAINLTWTSSQPTVDLILEMQLPNKPNTPGTDWKVIYLQSKFFALSNYDISNVVRVTAGIQLPLDRRPRQLPRSAAGSRRKRPRCALPDRHQGQCRTQLLFSSLPLFQHNQRGEGRCTLLHSDHASHHISSSGESHCVCR